MKINNKNIRTKIGREGGRERERERERGTNKHFL